MTTTFALTIRQREALNAIAAGEFNRSAHGSSLLKLEEYGLIFFDFGRPMTTRCGRRFLRDEAEAAGGSIVCA